jgi:hypothetical protein
MNRFRSHAELQREQGAKVAFKACRPVNPFLKR